MNNPLIEAQLYHYRATITSVYDGDTVTADIDLGLECWLKGQKIRLYGINAKELRGEERPEGIIARDFLRQAIDSVQGNVILSTYRDEKGKFGRWLAIIWADGRNLNEEMVSVGLAVHKDY